MNAAIVAAMCAVAGILYAWRRRKNQRSYERHTRQAIQLTLDLSTVEVPNPPAVIDRPPPHADKCAHITNGQTSRATVRVAGADMDVCGPCLATAMRGLQDINAFAQIHGIRHTEGN